jgi:hypothetical protein
MSKVFLKKTRNCTSNKMGTNNKYPCGSKLHIRTKEVKGAKSEADDVCESENLNVKIN